MKRSLGTVFSFWLIAQILLPFTAPFPVCDLGDLLGGTHHQGDRAPITPSDSSLADAAFASAPPLVTTAGRLKLVVVSMVGASDRFVIRPLVLLGGPFGSAAGTPLYLQLRQTVLRL